MEKDYQKEIEGYNIRKRFPRNPKKSAIIVIDMQNTFHYMVKDIMSNVIALISSCYDAGMKIIFTRYGYKGDTGEGKVMKMWWGDLAKHGSKRWELLPEMKKIITEKLNNDCHIIDKEGYSAFYKTNLDHYLKQNGIEEVLISGVMTNCCCASTARSAFDHGYQNYFISDANATVSDELHISQLKLLAYATSFIPSTKQMLDSLTK